MPPSQGSGDYPFVKMSNAASGLGDTLSPLPPLDYVGLMREGNPQGELIKTIELLADWLKVVDDGFGRMLEEAPADIIEEEEMGDGGKAYDGLDLEYDM